MKIMAIDPGNQKSAFCIFNRKTFEIDAFGKVENSKMEIELITDAMMDDFDLCVIEMVGHYGTGMPAGQEVFDTCIEIGRLTRICEEYGKEYHYIKRPTIKTELCGTPRAKDSNVIQALKDRFGDKGTKKDPGFFYGFKADCWQAFACGVAFVEQWNRGSKDGIL